MSINVGFPFKRTSAAPIDESFVLTKAQMVAADATMMPSNYFCVCKDDGKVYVYDKDNTADPETGKYRVQEGGLPYREVTQAEYNALTPEQKAGVCFFITDAGGGGGGGASEEAITALANRGWKNFIPYKIIKGGTSGGISASFPEYISENAEVLQVNGQASTDVNIVISEKFELNKGNYILSGLGNSYWAGAGADTYYLELVSSGTVIATYPQNPEFSITNYAFNCELRFVVKAMPSDKWFDSDADGSIIYPMIRDASISDPTYIAPSLGLRELSELVKKSATGKDANIRGTDSTIRVTNVTNREVSILADTSSKKITVTSAKAGETPRRFELGITSAYGTITPTVSGFGGDVRYQSKNGYATITGTLINSTVPLTQRVETKFAELPTSLKPIYEINAPISHHDLTTASTLRIKSNGDLCIYPPTNIPQGTAMFMCVTYPIEN